jgi:Putative Na+/H+ antiporter
MTEPSRSHTPALFVGGFLVFLAFSHATAPYQNPINLRPALLVGFFLAGLVVHRTLQQWWIEPVLGRLPALPLFVGAIVLSALNDNAAITYLASLVPGFTPDLRYAVMAGAVTAGGLTVIANAPNPAGQAILGRYFQDGISPCGSLPGPRSRRRSWPPSSWRSTDSEAVPGHAVTRRHADDREARKDTDSSAPQR